MDSRELILGMAPLLRMGIHGLYEEKSGTSRLTCIVRLEMHSMHSISCAASGSLLDRLAFASPRSSLEQSLELWRCKAMAQQPSAKLQVARIWLWVYGTTGAMTCCETWVCKVQSDDIVHLDHP